MEIALGDLLSRAKRIAFSEEGRKTIKRAFTQEQEEGGSGDDGGPLGAVGRWLWGGVKNVVGFVVSKAWDWISKGISWTFSTIAQWCVSTFQYIWSFDWNMSDAQIDQQIEQQYNALLTQTGSALGQAMGWLVCGLAPGAVMFAFNEALGVYLLNHVGQEALEEILPTIGNLVRTTLRTVTRHAFLATYKRARAWLLDSNEMKSVTDDQLKASAQASVTNGELSQAEANDWLQKQQRIRDAAKNGYERKPWSFQKQFQQWRENNIPKRLQDAAEEFVEEFSEACTEAIMCLAAGGDAYVAMQKNSAASVLGGQEVVEITFNREVEQQNRST